MLLLTSCSRFFWEGVEEELPEIVKVVEAVEKAE